MRQAQYFGYSGDRVKGLIFGSRIEEAKQLSEKFNKRGWRTLVLSGNDASGIAKDKNAIYYLFAGIQDQVVKEYCSKKKKSDIIITEYEKHLLEEEQDFKYFIASLLDCCITNLDWKELCAEDSKDTAKKWENHIGIRTGTFAKIFNRNLNLCD